MKQGIYCLIISLNKSSKIKVGKKGKIFFPKGYYCYIGSALNNLEKRIARHNSTKKRIHWHIDYFLNRGKITGVKIIGTKKKKECWLSKRIEMISDNSIKGFGCSDCKCKTHLYYFKKNPLTIKEFLDIF